MRSWMLVLVWLAAAGLARAADMAAVERLVKPFVDERWVMGCAVAVIDGDRVEVRGFGRRSGQEAQVPDGDTRFEVASVSKALTALVAADAGLDFGRKAQELLPSTVRVPSKDSKEITLRMLAQHRSGLAKMPPYVDPVPGDPYHGFTPETLMERLATAELATVPGEAYAYSNFGVAVLGRALEAHAGKRYEDLMQERLFAPLGMTRTGFGTDGVVPGHDAELEPVPFWSWGPFRPAGGVVSTANDLGRLVAACLDPRSKIAGAVATCQAGALPAWDGVEIGLGWHHDLKRGYWFHDGASGGFRSFVAFSPGQRRGLVMLANATGYALTNGLAPDANLATGLARLVFETGEAPGRPTRWANLTGAELARYAGVYALDAEPELKIRFDVQDGHLVATVQTLRMAIYPAGGALFMDRGWGMVTTFDADASGVMFPLEGSPLHCTRVASSP